MPGELAAATARRCEKPSGGANIISGGAQPLGDEAQLLGAAGVAEHHVGAGLLVGLAAPERLVDAADAHARWCAR